jgi:phosphomannomutase
MSMVPDDLATYRMRHAWRARSLPGALPSIGPAHKISFPLVGEVGAQHTGSLSSRGGQLPALWFNKNDLVRFGNAMSSVTAPSAASSDASQPAAPPASYAFGTSGYRSNTPEGTSEDVVRTITHGIADYFIGQMHQQKKAQPLLVGGDTRALTQRYTPLITQLLLDRGLDVYQVPGFIPTPVLALASKYFDRLGQPHREVAGSFLLTASHNPWDYLGINFLTNDGAVVPSHTSKAFERLQREPTHAHLDRSALGLTAPAQLRHVDPTDVYAQHLKDKLGLQFDKIKHSGLRIVYDPLYATGQNVLPDLLKNAGIPVSVLHGTPQRPADYTGMPEPNAENLKELSGQVQEAAKTPGMVLGLANDGDADRFGIMDETGKLVSPNDVLALTLYHLAKHRPPLEGKQGGAVVRSQATSHMLDALAKKAGLSVVQTPVGYKYIAETFIDHEAPGKPPVWLGGESSGGLSIHGHIPEKDGILANLLVAELMANEKKPLSQVLKEVKAALPQHYQFNELAIKTPKGKDILSDFLKKASHPGTLGNFVVDVEKTQQEAEALEKHFGTRDGAKLYFKDGSWALVRISGTEPLVRLYTETTHPDASQARMKSDALLAQVKQILSQGYGVTDNDIKMK